MFFQYHTRVFLCHSNGVVFKRCLGAAGNRPVGVNASIRVVNGLRVWEPGVTVSQHMEHVAVSAHGDLHMSVSLLAFFVVYTSVFGVGYSYMVRLIRKGPQPHETFATESDGRPARPLSAVTTEHKEQP